MSSVMPCEATVSRSFDKPSTVHASSIFGDGSPLQMLFTPNAAHCRRIASLWPCCVPTFMVAFGAGRAPDFAGDFACCADTTASASAGAESPAPASRTNSRRFISALPKATAEHAENAELVFLCDLCDLRGLHFRTSYFVLQTSDFLLSPPRLTRKPRSTLRTLSWFFSAISATSAVCIFVLQTS